MKKLEKLKVLFVFLATFMGLQLVLGYLFLHQVEMQDKFLVLGFINASIIIGFMLISKRYNVQFFNAKTLTLKNIGWSFLVYFGVNVVLRSVVEWLPTEKLVNQESLEMSMHSSSVGTILIATVVLAPICEEVLFRGVFMHYVFKNQQWIGLLLSSSLFAVMHNGVTLTAFVIYGAMGCNLGLVYMKTKSLECAIMMHAFNNLIASLVALGILV